MVRLLPNDAVRVRTQPDFFFRYKQTARLHEYCATHDRLLGSGRGALHLHSSARLPGQEYRSAGTLCQQVAKLLFHESPALYTVPYKCDCMLIEVYLHSVVDRESSGQHAVTVFQPSTPDSCRCQLQQHLGITKYNSIREDFITDVFTWDGLFDVPDEPYQQRNNEPHNLVDKSCSCEGPSCNCCLDFNLTYIDLGGPGCVHMKYLSPADGIAVNVSYGNRLLHTEVVRGANPEPSCIDILSDLAQLCSRFSDFAPTSDGLRWCLQLEPTLLGDVQAQYQVGCFRMGPEGMAVDPPTTNTAAQTSNTDPSPTSTPSVENLEEINEEALIAAVNESAEEGIAFFSNLLGITFGGGEAPGNTTEADNTTDTTAQYPTVEHTPPP
ncbi:hypothetical protein Cfor_08895 [Coptotermes formosanus]|uniref:DUF4773 domain-containing protein n=1 Tax=Coptotermes formosanus TaxID=36987 RepID=A0A6L2PEJ2_COPFO|nr:hypothetical protein Cfor_08895 [Coptotermes formosanus]